MAIDDEHPEYSARKSQWQKMRDCAAGQDAIYAGKTNYLPKLSGQDDKEYKAYQQRAPFYEATARTIDGLSGMIFRKAPTWEVPDGFKPFLQDVTLDGTTLLGFAEDIVDEDITVARAGILVDHPSVGSRTTKSQAEASNIRPFMKKYPAEQIFNWKTESRNNAQVLTQVRLWEFVELQGDDEFETIERTQIRILDLTETGIYRQRVFIKVKYPRSMKEEWVQLGEDIFPLKNGAPLNFIPFWFVGVKNGQAKTEKPPLLGMANINISHFQSSADLEHGAHFTGLPTAVIIGHTDEDAGSSDEFRIGSATAWIFPNENAKVEYLEFEGTGLDALEKRVEKKEQQMAYLGARMLQPDKKAAETAETAGIHRMGETSVLASLAQSAAQSIEGALKFMVEWAGFPAENVTFKLNKDFLAVQMDAPKLQALLQTWQAGGMAFADFLDNLKRGEIIREERTEDEIRSEVETSNPFNEDDMPPRPQPVNA